LNLRTTAGGLVFTGALDAYLRAFDAKSGAELWQGRLPVPGVANPMTYTWNGEQYVVIAAGGHSEAGTSIGDSVVAFRLARAGESPSLWSRTIDRPGGRFWGGAIVAAMAFAALLLIVVRYWRRRARSSPLPTGEGAHRACGTASIKNNRVPAFAVRKRLIERDADPLVAAPDRAAAADELIGFDHQHE
jgi:hypothetical protein